MEQEKLILLVEDNPDDQFFIRRALSKEHAKSELVVVNDGLEALDFLYARGKFAARDPKVLPRLIILDLNIPKITGLEVLQEIKKHDSTRIIPVIIFTTSGEERDILDSYRRGANSYITKPVDIQQYNEIVQRLGSYWISTNVAPGTRTTQNG